MERAVEDGWGDGLREADGQNRVSVRARVMVMVRGGLGLES